MPPSTLPLDLLPLSARPVVALCHFPGTPHSIMLRLLDSFCELPLTFLAGPCGWSTLPFALTTSAFEYFLPRFDPCSRVIMDENGVMSFDNFFCPDYQYYGSFLIPEINSGVPREGSCESKFCIAVLLTTRMINQVTDPLIPTRVKRSFDS